jgi:hypothetical protein
VLVTAPSVATEARDNPSSLDVRETALRALLQRSALPMRTGTKRPGACSVPTLGLSIGPFFSFFLLFFFSFFNFFLLFLKNLF